MISKEKKNEKKGECKEGKADKKQPEAKRKR